MDRENVMAVMLPLRCDVMCCEVPFLQEYCHEPTGINQYSARNDVTFIYGRGAPSPSRDLFFFLIPFLFSRTLWKLARKEEEDFYSFYD